MQYEEGERDFVMLQHKFGIEWADGRKETRTSTLCEYGEKVGSGKDSAMAKLVGVPCGVAVKMVLDGKINEKVSCTSIVVLGREFVSVYLSGGTS